MNIRRFADWLTLIKIRYTEHAYPLSIRAFIPTTEMEQSDVDRSITNGFSGKSS
jgi:hypothetical protein